MGKYSMTRAVKARTVQARDLYGTSALNDDAVNKLRYVFSNVGAFGIYPLKMIDEYNFMNDYLNTRGMKWSDMKYPSIAPHSGSVNWKLSKNVLKELYD